MWFDVPVPHGEEPGDVQRPATETTESIWSTDDVPVRDGPLDIVWARRAEEVDEPISLARPQTTFDAPVETTDPQITKERSVRSKLLIGGGVLLAVAVVVGVMVRSGDDESAVPDTTVDESTPSTTSEASSTTDDPVDERAASETGADVESTPSIEIELPAAVAAIQTPTEVVMVTVDGLVHTLSLPSGRVRSVAPTDATVGGDSGFGGGVVVAPEASAIARPDGRALVIVPRTGLPVTVDADEFGGEIGGFQATGWWRAGDGAERFVVAIYPPDGGNATFASVGLDGDVVPLLAPQAVSSGFGLTTPDGTWIVNDAGGAYEVDATGTSRRIDNGVVQAAARDHRLVRECDEFLQCSNVLVRVSDGERQVIDPALLPDEFNGTVYGMTMAPDGSAVSMVRSGANQQERVIIDLGVGEVASAPSGFWPQGSTWAADSSGIFDARIDGPGLQFLARTGEIVTFGEDLGQVVSAGVRWPDAELDPTVTVVSETVSAARPLAPTGITIVGALTSGGVTYIDVDAGVAQSWATTDRLASELTLITSDDAILALGSADDPAFAFRQGVQEPLEAVFAARGLKLPGPVDGTIWVPAPDLGTTRGGVAYRLVTLDGMSVESTGATIDLPEAELLGSDGRGGLVVRRAGDVFAIGVDGADRLTTGELIAIGADVTYVSKCAEIARCDLSRVDRRSGARSTTAGGFEPGRLPTAVTSLGAAFGTSVSPDGDVLLVKLPEDSPGDAPVPATWALADTTRGRLTLIDGFDASQPVVWSADSNFAAVLADSNLFVFDRAAGELVPLSTPRLRAIGSAASPSPTAPAS
jgi:hypothetical protein